MKRVVVTGALGHIGSRLIRSGDFLSRFDEIVIIDDLRSQRHSALFSLPSPLKFSVIFSDVRDVNLEPLLDRAEAVVHLAALTDAEKSASRPRETKSNNLGATIHLLKACNNTGTKLIFPSSTSVYGDQDKSVDEQTRTENLRPQSPYARSKILEERAVTEFSAAGGISHTIFRFGTIFGVSPGMRFHTAVNKFCWQARFGIPLTVWRSAVDQVRPYLAIEDAVSAIELAVSSPSKFEGVTNVLTGNHSIKEVLAAIRLTGATFSVNLVDSPIMNQLSYKVSNKKSISYGLVYSGHLETGILQTMSLLGGADRPEQIFA